MPDLKSELERVLGSGDRAGKTQAMVMVEEDGTLTELPDSVPETKPEFLSSEHRAWVKRMYPKGSLVLQFLSRIEALECLFDGGCLND